MEIFMTHVGNFVGMCKFYFMNHGKISMGNLFFFFFFFFVGHSSLDVCFFCHGKFLLVWKFWYRMRFFVDMNFF